MKQIKTGKTRRKREYFVRFALTSVLSLYHYYRLLLSSQGEMNVTSKYLKGFSTKRYFLPSTTASWNNCVKRQ